MGYESFLVPCQNLKTTYICPTSLESSHSLKPVKTSQLLRFIRELQTHLIVTRWAVSLFLQFSASFKYFHNMYMNFIIRKTLF